MPHHLCVPLQVVKEARRLGAFCVRGNHDDSALAAYHAAQRSEHIDVRSLRTLPVLLYPRDGITADMVVALLSKSRVLHNHPDRWRWQCLAQRD